MNKKYLINDRVSESPLYWIAIYKGGRLINQINESGEICQKWSDLDLEKLDFWGFVSNLGCYGFYLNKNICYMNGSEINIDPVINKKINYKRTILASSDGRVDTKSAEISFGGHSIMLSFIPEVKVVFNAGKE